MSVYKGYSTDELEAVGSQFLIDSWSYSKVTSFARNEKAFEMQYLFHCPSRSSSSNIAGNAYHEALASYFSNKKEGNILSLIDLQQVAYEYIDNVAGNQWKLQKTTPTVDECKIKATVTVSSLLEFFYKEKAVVMQLQWFHLFRNSGRQQFQPFPCFFNRISINLAGEETII